MNIESATAFFVFTLDFEKYTKENIFQTLNAFFLITRAFFWKILLNRPPIWGGLQSNIFLENASVFRNRNFKFKVDLWTLIY